VSTQSELPDIVLIHGHDLGRWLSIYGMSHVPSPNIAAFAADAVVFESAHSAAPLCSPARGALFTGISPHRNGIQGLVHDAWRYREGVVTAPEHLRAAGYHSALIGLQHENVDPTVLGFDECPGLGFLPRSYQAVEATSDWLARVPTAGEREPIFLTIGTWEGHRPWPHDDYEPGEPEKVDVPPYLPDNEHTRRDIADFYGSIRQFDRDFGRLLALIDDHFDADNTMVILTTDHGAAFPRAKSTLYDAGTGVTLIVRPPRSWACPTGRVEALVSHLDVLPTLLDAAGAAIPPELEGISLLPLIRGDTEGDPNRVIFTAKSYHDVYDPKRAARSLSYTYIRNYAAGPRLQLAIDLEKSATRQGMGDDHLGPRPQDEFYDRSVDPDELHDRAKDPSYASLRDNYSTLLSDYLRASGDPITTMPLEPATPRSRAVDALPAAPRPTWSENHEHLSGDSIS
jgi:arylsulfatase A-like enzyme